MDWLTPSLLSEAELAIETDSSLSKEQYNLIIGSNAKDLIIIRSSSRIGSLHALRTLSQLIAFFGRNLPAMVIDDEPAFPNRGVMLDVSRDRVPRMDELFRVVHQLASWKINHLQLYTEHTFRYRGHNEVWRGSSPFTPVQIRRLDSECQKLGISLAANQNCFGHMTRWLKHPRYASLAETHGDWEWEGRLFPGPFSLYPLDPGSIELVEDLLGQLLPNFSSGLVNINCDETLDLGQGRSKEAVAKQGSAALYFEFVQKIVDSVERKNFRPMFWADIALSHPEELHRIPVGMISLAWGYEGNAPFGDWCRRLSEVGGEVWVCPGTSSWRSITGRTTERRGNIRAAVLQGRANGANGFLMTDWGDEGHRQQWPVSLIGLAEAADAAWSGKSDPPDDDTLDRFLFEAPKLILAGKPASSVTAWLRELGDADLPLREIYGKPSVDGSTSHLRNSSALYVEMQREDVTRPPISGLVNLWEDTLLRITSLARSVPATDPQISQELSHTVEVAELAATIALMRISPETRTADPRKILRRLDNVISEHRRLWKLRSRPGGLNESVSYYSKVKQRVEKEFL